MASLSAAAIERVMLCRHGRNGARARALLSGLNHLGARHSAVSVSEERVEQRLIARTPKAPDGDKGDERAGEAGRQRWRATHGK